MLREKGMMLNELMQLDFRLKDLQLFWTLTPMSSAQWRNII